MKNLEFTPGPWEIHPDPNFTNTLHIVGDVSLSTAGRIDYQPVGTVFEGFHQRGNARLIENAPDMYLLLKDVQQMLREGSPVDPMLRERINWTIANIERNNYVTL